MRYSTQTKQTDPIDLTDSQKSNRSFFEEVAKRASRRERECALLFVGGNTAGDHAIRRAQAPLRFDGLDTFWSHVALVLEWPGDAAQAKGVEVTPEPLDPRLQVPERNAVTPFSLERYFDAGRYRNVAYATFRLDEQERPRRGSAPKPKLEAVSRRERFRTAALDPNRERVRYPLHQWLAPWLAFRAAPTSVPNPLQQGVPYPSAAFCEYAFAAAQVDVTPGATAANTCPETLWSTLRWWTKPLAETGVHLRVWLSLRDPKCDSRPTYPTPLRLDGGDAPRGG
ncbi:MAG TPA: hypothetical protein VKE69_07755 [Planctomycetota bacterium]|nr:hypothetical protein [Planctomycetota bacterium]